MVRRALAEALAGAFEAPRAVVLALAADQSEVAAVVLGRSPLLTDAELVDFAAAGDAAAQAPSRGGRACRQASRRRWPKSAGAKRRSRSPTISTPTSGRARCGGCTNGSATTPEAREALASRPNLPPALRNELAAATARALAEFAARCDWLSAERAQRIARDAREQATATIVCNAAGDELAELARRMRAAGTLTVAALMRALLCGDREFFVQALSELSGLPPRRVAALARAPEGQGFAALYAKAGLPAPSCRPSAPRSIALEAAGRAARRPPIAAVVRAGDRRL